MSRRRADGSDVKGPTSALTSFLKERGIRARNVRSGYSRRIDDGDDEQQNQPVAGPSGTSSPRTGASTPGAGPSTPALASLGETAEEDDELSDQIDSPFPEPGTPAAELDMEEVSVSVAASRTSTTGASTSRQTVEASVSTSKRKMTSTAKESAKKKKKIADSDDEYDVMKDITVAPKARYADRKPGSFAMCAECNKKFTITRYTNMHPDIANGLLCGPCDKEIGPAALAGGIGKGKSAAGNAAAAKKKARAVKNKSITLKEKPTVMSLTKCCIELIGKAIEDVEDFGDIGSANKDKVCQIVCKNRDLTKETLKLFLDVENTTLSLYDCARLEGEALRMLANHCPNLETLKLFMCGFMDDETLLHFGDRLQALKHLQLYAPYLIRKAAWIEYFEKLQKYGRELEGFMIRQTPRIDDSVLASLVTTCPNLTHLQLAECGSLDDNSLSLLKSLKKLRHLDLSRLDISQSGIKCVSFSDDAMISLLESVGGNLQVLNLDGNSLLTDRTLIEGVKVNCPELIDLSIGYLSEVLPTGIAELFSDDWINKKGFVRLNFHRCNQLDDDALMAVVKHSGSSLLKLDLNSVDSMRETSLKYLAEHAPNLVELDVSFVREIDDFLLKHFLDHMPALQRIYIYGNNRVSDLCPSKPGVKVLGHEQGVVNVE